MQAHRVAKMETPPETEACRRFSDGQAGLRNVDRWSANSEASWTVLFPGRDLARADEEVREVEVIYQHGPEYAGQTQEALVGPGQLATPA